MPMLSQQSNDNSNEKTLPAIRIAELPALRGAETPARPLVAASAQANGAAFVPQSFELGFGVDKPGAAFHQIVQCVGTAPATDSDMMHSALPTTYLRRDPQRFAPPPRSSLHIDFDLVRGTKFERADGRMTARIAWTETLSIVPMEKSGFSDSLAIVKVDGAEEYTIQEPDKCLRWFVRLGEQITEIDSQLPMPLKAVAEKRSVEAFDVFIVTRITDLWAERDLNNGDGTKVKPKLVEIVLGESGPEYKAWPADEIFGDVTESGDYKIWRLTRPANDSGPTPPTILNRLAPAETRLNLAWWKDADTITDDVYKKAPKLLAAGEELTTRDVPYQPQSPRVHAVLRSKEDSFSGILGKVRELTLIDGPAASSNGLNVKLHSTEGEQPWLRFDAADVETVALSDPFTTDASAELHMVKVFDDGATVETHQEIAASTVT